jgi:hypothetical protein
MLVSEKRYSFFYVPLPSLPLVPRGGMKEITNLLHMTPVRSKIK